MSYTCQCPVCHGAGEISDFVCCGMDEGSGCCGNPDLAMALCAPCAGSGSMDNRAFLDYALLSRDLALLAQHESMEMLSGMSIPEAFKKQSSRL